MRPVLLLCALLLSGCDRFQTELPGLFATAPRIEPQTSPKSSQPTQLSQLVRQLEGKLKPPAMATVGSTGVCSRAPSLAQPDAQALQLILANVDARAYTKNLIPRRVSERLESGESSLLATLAEPSLASASGELHRDAPVSATSLTLDDLDRIQRQRFLGVFYITDYQGAALILRVGKIRREWLAGSLSAKFVLFDSEQQRVICATDLRVTNDVKSAPIRSRLQAETRSRLERELGDALRLEAERAMARSAPELVWPDSGMHKGV
jgi:hypothetical protein